MSAVKMAPTRPEAKHPLEASQSWALYTLRQQDDVEVPGDNGVRRILKKTNDERYSGSKHGDHELVHRTGAIDDPDIQVSHKPRKHKIPKVRGSTMHGIMIDAGSVRNCAGSKNVDGLIGFTPSQINFVTFDRVARYSYSHL